jgi:hypothetical protein
VSPCYPRKFLTQKNRAVADLQNYSYIGGYKGWENFADAEEINEKINALQLALQNEETISFELLLDLITKSNVRRMTIFDVIHTPAQFKRLIQIKKEEVTQFLEKSKTKIGD